MERHAPAASKIKITFHFEEISTDSRWRSIPWFRHYVGTIKTSISDQTMKKIHLATKSVSHGAGYGQQDLRRRVMEHLSKWILEIHPKIASWDG